MIRGKLLLALLALSMSSCGQSVAVEDPDAPAATPVEVQHATDDFETVLDEYLALNQRLEDVAYRVLRGNSANCPETVRDIGLKIHTVHDYPDELQLPARLFLDLDIHPLIRVIAESSPAEQAGLNVGDRVLKLGAFDIPSGKTAGSLFDAVSVREFRMDSAALQIKRGDAKPMTIEVRPQTVCGYPAQLFYSEIVNAHTDGEEIWVTSELIRQLEDDESLALVIAHELAHATEGHVFQEPTKALELVADQLSISYLKNAGFDPALAIENWKQNPAHHKQDESVTHPSFDERLDVMEAALKALD